ncbi:CPBP family intramembrane metalloprotease [Flavobacterium sp. 140616W15]|nr:CPBP family intramembrane metalloprotease [Flavobacterium sp. 140616W15]
MEAINKKYFKTFFYLLTISFGLIHIVNFYKIVPSNLLYLTPIFVLPQIALSFFTAYIRMKNGFIWGFLLHFLYNLPITLFYLLKT